MKTIMDAVNELRGDLENIEQSGCSAEFIVVNIRTGVYYRSWICEDCYGDFNDFRSVCVVKQFYNLVHELSSAPWIKGASLAEYQEADKEVLKVENKTDEVDGMVYEIGKYYVLSDSLDSTGICDKLAEVYPQDSDYKFVSTSGAAWRFCSTINGEAGTITPVPVKLVDGDAYRFSARGKMFNWIYENFGDKFNVMAGQFFNLANCTNIIPLVPEGANSLSK